jgi:hypothetical protein
MHDHYYQRFAEIEDAPTRGADTNCARSNRQWSKKRGVSRREAMAYLGDKGRFFDERICPNLAGAWMGTGVIFDLVELYRVFEEYEARGDGQPTVKEDSTWAENSPASTSTTMGAGRSTGSLARKVRTAQRASAGWHEPLRHEA